MNRPKDSTLSVVVALIFLIGWLGTFAAMSLLGRT